MSNFSYNSYRLADFVTDRFDVVNPDNDIFSKTEALAFFAVPFPRKLSRFSMIK